MVCKKKGNKHFQKSTVGSLFADSFKLKYIFVFNGLGSFKIWKLFLNYLTCMLLYSIIYYYYYYYLILKKGCLKRTSCLEVSSIRSLQICRINQNCNLEIPTVRKRAIVDVRYRECPIIGRPIIRDAHYPRCRLSAMPIIRDANYRRRFSDPQNNKFEENLKIENVV